MKLAQCGAALAIIGALLAIPQAPVASTPLTQTAQAACTITIPSTVKKIDGLGNYSQIRPGAVLCLPAGTRGNLKLFNLHGTADQPIVVRNSGGTVRITGLTYTGGGISIIDSSFVRVTGTGISDRCGAEYDPAEQQCGIEITQTYKGVTVVTKAGNSHDFEIDHLYIHDTSTAISSRGIGIHPEEGQTVSGFYAHHNYVHDTRGEGFYVGSEPHGKPLSDVGKLVNVEVSYNLVERTGYDGIKVKVAIDNVKVHHNVVHDAGLRGALHHESGIQLAMSVGDVYNNFVQADIEGLATGRPLDNPTTRYFNNIIVGGQNAGMNIAENNAQIYNNTVVRSGIVGIKAGGGGARIFDNIVAGVSGSAIQGKSASIFNNLVGSIASAGFVNPADDDYHLLAGSPAVNAGRNTGLFPLFDFDDVSRPQGSQTDLGAFELVAP